MISEGEPLQDTDGPSKLDQAKEAVQAATQTVKETTQSVADAIEAGRQPGAPLDPFCCSVSRGVADFMPADADDLCIDLDGARQII